MAEPRRNDRTWAVAAWIAWAVLTVVVCVAVARDPEKRTVTHVFRAAADAWWAEGRVYDGGWNGFLYLPQTAVLYTPFMWPPLAVGEVLWRIFSLILFVSGLWRLIKIVSDRPPTALRALRLAGPGMAFAIATVVCLAPVYSNARNGQHNLPLAALMMHAAADLFLGRWWRATLSLCLGTALKPLGLVMACMAAALYPRTIWRLAVGMVGVAALPLMHPNPEFAVRTYRDGFSTLEAARQVEMPRGQDLRGIFVALGWAVPPMVLSAVRLAAVPLMPLVAWVARRRWGEPAGATFTFVMTTIYLTLFNPRAEGLTYVILAPAVAALLVTATPPARGRGAIAVLIAVAVVVSASQTITGGVNTWMRWLVWAIVRGRD
jgi:alpha-1,2-mannosyltransferase